MTKPTKRLFLALIPLMLVVVVATVTTTIPVNAQSQTPKASINQEVKNAMYICQYVNNIWTCK